MFISREREKLLNAMLFFVKSTKYCHKLKLFKLLNFLDFEHYRQTGRPVTGLKYEAWPMGPVPAELDTELSNPPSDMRSDFSIVKIPDRDKLDKFRVDFRAKRQFDPRFFSKRETGIMNELAFIFHEYRGDDMSELSHYRSLPWHKVYRGGLGRGHVIPYDLALTSQNIVSGDTIDAEELEFRRDALEGIS